MSIKNWGMFLAGAALGGIGVKLLSDDEAKKVLSKATAAVLRATDDIIEDAYDIYDSALEYNFLKDACDLDDDLDDFLDEAEEDLSFVDEEEPLGSADSAAPTHSETKPEPEPTPEPQTAARDPFEMIWEDN